MEKDDWGKGQFVNNHPLSSRSDSEAALHDGLEEWRADLAVRDPEAYRAYEDNLHRAALIDSLLVAREASGRTQKDIAAAMGTTQSAVSELETRRVEPRLSTVQRYARAVRRRVDLAVVAEGWPVYTEDRGRMLWRTIERRALSPILTALATEKRENRTLAGLAKVTDHDAEVIEHLLRSLADRKWVAADSADGIYSIGDRAAYVIGISIEADHVIGVLANLRMKVLHHREQTVVSLLRQDVIEAIIDVVHQLYTLRGEQNVIGVGVCIAGGVTASHGIVKFAPDLHTTDDPWHNVPLAGELQDRLQHQLADEDLRVIVDNDANALAVHQYLKHASAQGYESNEASCVAVVLLTGGGIGAGFVVHGDVMYGANSLAGEGGHTILDPSGEECRAELGHRGCLETIASARAMFDKLDLPSADASQIRSSFKQMSQRVQRGDARTEAVIDEAGQALGQFVSVLVATTDPGRVIIYAFPELADEVNYESAMRFQAAVDHGFEVASSKGDQLERLTHLSWIVVGHQTRATAAAAAVTRKFLYRPYYWAPTILDPAFAT